MVPLSSARTDRSSLMDKPSHALSNLIYTRSVKDPKGVAASYERIINFVTSSFDLDGLKATMRHLMRLSCVKIHALQVHFLSPVCCIVEGVWFHVWIVTVHMHTHTYTVHTYRCTHSVSTYAHCTYVHSYLHIYIHTCICNLQAIPHPSRLFARILELFVHSSHTTCKLSVQMYVCCTHAIAYVVHMHVDL